MVSEFSLIKSISSKIGSVSNRVHTGIGDDCAVIPFDDKRYQLLTTDALVENVHFDLKYFSLEDVGYKSLAVNLSDIAAMGGIPRQALVSLGIPETLPENDVLKIYNGMLPLAQKFAVDIVGGNVSRSTQGLWISITLVGEVAKTHCKLRNGAHAGDHIYVTGSLGQAAYHFGVEPSTRQKRPVPRLEVGQFLGSLSFVSAMMDISDGLSSDLAHLLEASRVPGAIIEKEKLGTAPIDDILNGGEDYELLFTVPGPQKSDFEKCAKESGYNFYQIGILTDEKGLFLLQENRKTPIISKGYDHLKS